MSYKAPTEHLFELLGIEKTAKEGIYTSGKGYVSVIRQDPKEFVLKPDADKQFVDVVKQMYGQKAHAGTLVFKNNFCLTRGAYEIISVVDEGVNSEPYTIKGRLIDLFDPTLPVINQKQVNPGEQAYLFNIGKVSNPELPQVLASASRVYDEKAEKHSYSFITKSPLNTTNVMRILLPSEPQKITLTQADGTPVADVKKSWDALGKTCFLSFENMPDGVNVELQW